MYHPEVYQALLGYTPWDMRAVFWEAFASTYKTGVMAIAGGHDDHVTAAMSGTCTCAANEKLALSEAATICRMN